MSIINDEVVKYINEKFSSLDLSPMEKSEILNEYLSSNDSFSEIKERIDKKYNELVNKNKSDTSIEKLKEIMAYIDLNVYLNDNNILIDLKDIPIVHLGSSVILLSHPKLSFATGVRMGIVLYGYDVSPTYSNKGLKNKLRNIRNKHYQKKYNISPLIYNTKLDLKPAMSMTTSILQIKKVRKGETIGYGASYKAKEDMKVAILPVGYNNGIGRKNIDRFVIINSKKCPVVGEMSMNMMIVKVDKNVELNDKVYILGGGITLGMLSRMDGSSISGTLLNIGKNNKKTYLKNDKIEYVEE